MYIYTRNWYGWTQQICNIHMPRVQKTEIKVAFVKTNGSKKVHVIGPIVW